LQQEQREKDEKKEMEKLNTHDKRADEGVKGKGENNKQTELA